MRFRIIFTLCIFSAVWEISAAGANAGDEVWQKYRLPNTVNSYQPAIVPVCDFDESILYFDRKFYLNNTGGVNDRDDIWLSKLYGSPTKAAEPGRVSAPINSEQSDVLFFLNPGGNAALVSGCYNKNGAKEAGYSIIRKDSEGRWGTPQALKIKNYRNDSTVYSATLSPDEQILLLSLAAPGGFGGMDLYFSKFDKNSASWSEPQNLGSVVNSTADEVSPCLSADNRTLYFASKNEKSYGGFDIFISRRLDDSWKNWSDPENPGSKINTVKDDNYFWLTSDGASAYMVSYDGETNLQGIYKVVIPEKFRPGFFAYIRGSVLQLTGNKTYSFAGSVVRINVVKANSADTLSFFSNGETSEFIIPTDAPGDYSLEAVAPDGFRSRKSFVNISENSDRKIYSQDIMLEKVKKNIAEKSTPITSTERLGTILFDFDSDILSPNAIIELNNIAGEITAKQINSIEISGYADAVGTESYNNALSQKRASAAEKYLRSKCGNLKIKSIGYGKSRLEHMEADSQYLNRKVEISTGK